MPFYACKLPHGVEIDHDGKKIVLVGANIGEKLEHVSPNGLLDDSRRRSHGFGITELDSARAEALEAWRAINAPKGTKSGFIAFENGSIMGPFKSRNELEKEVGSLYSVIKTGVEGVDPEEEKKKAEKSKKTDKQVGPVETLEN